MNISDVATRFASEFAVNKTSAKQMVESVLASIAEGAKADGEAALSGFGRFRVTSRPAREGRNPRTGEPMMIAASRKLIFTPAKAVKDALNR